MVLVVEDVIDLTGKNIIGISLVCAVGCGVVNSTADEACGLPHLEKVVILATCRDQNVLGQG